MAEKLNNTIIKEQNIDGKLLKISQVHDYPNNMKRLPKNSFTIIIDFHNLAERDKFMNDPQFKSLYGELVVLASNLSIKKVETVPNP